MLSHNSLLTSSYDPARPCKHRRKPKASCWWWMTIQLWRRSLHTTLFSMGFDIGEASSGEEAVALCRIVKYDAVLLDINMPGKGGVETCRQLRRLMPRIAILMLSVNDDAERKVEALEAGADDYVTKPFHMRELTARIRAALRRPEPSPNRLTTPLPSAISKFSRRAASF